MRTNPGGLAGRPVNYRNGDDVVGKGALKTKPCGFTISSAGVAVIKGRDGESATATGPGTFPGEVSEFVSFTGESTELLVYFD